jgi:DNA polymerase-3 subunit delta'
MVIGHQQQWNLLQRAAKAASFSHAYLFAGCEKLGKKKMALEWISLLLRQEVKEDNSHPDLMFVQPQAKEIKIAQIKDLIRHLSLTAGDAGIKAAVINDAHLMNQEAQTCLLKTLEEPRGRALLILVTDKPQELLPTIASRAQALKFYPVSDQEIDGYLIKQGIAAEDRQEILRFSLGRPGEALEFISNPQKIKTFHDRIKEADLITKADLTFRFSYVKDLAEDVLKTREVLDIWTLYFREKLIGTVRDQQPTIKLRRALSFLQQISSWLSNTNVNTKLVLEMLMLEIN